MSSRLDMLQTAQRSRNLLRERTPVVARYLRSQLASDGGFCGRGGTSDLYYTVFGLEALLAAGGSTPPAVVPYLTRFGTGEDLDLVHLCCLVRARASADLPFTAADTRLIMTQLERYRASDGGYDQDPGVDQGSAYGAFLVTMAYEDLGLTLPSPDGLVSSLLGLRSDDGGFVNAAGQGIGLTPTTAAVAAVLGSLGADRPAGLETWLLGRHLPEGGFCAAAGVPLPDLLSTATALQALAVMGAPVDGIRETCAAFVLSLEDKYGAFCSGTFDPTPDCEYTYYGLLALGHLAS